MHPVENNMATINQEKIGFPIFRWMLLPLSGFPHKLSNCTGNAIIAAIGKKDCATTTMSGLFFPATIFSSDWGSEQ